MRTILFIILLSTILTACSQESDIAIGKAPEGMDQQFYVESVEVLTLINSKMNAKDKMNSREERKIDSYFEKHHGTNSIESKVRSSLAILHPTYKVYIQSDDEKEKVKIVEKFNSDYQELSRILQIE